MEKERHPLAQSIIFLYESKQLDKFLKTCEDAQRDGVNLAQLQHQENIPFDLPTQFRLMK